MGALMAGGIAAAIGIVVAIWPDLWLGLFTADPGALASGRTYLSIVGPVYGFFGLAMALYFASQGTGDAQKLAACYVEGQGHPAAVAVCLAAPNLTVDQRIALECAAETNGALPAFAACTGGRLATKELINCRGKRFADGNCFGENNEIRKLVPSLDLSNRARFPIMAGLYHPPGGIIRHDAVVWGYARACDRMGIEIHPYTEVTGIRVEGGRAGSVITTRGEVGAGAVVNATAGWPSLIARMAGVPLPIVSHPLQACVTEPLKPFLDKVIVSASLHVYVNQTDKGELVLGAEIDPYQSYNMAGTLPTLEQIASEKARLEQEREEEKERVRRKK